MGERGEVLAVNLGGTWLFKMMPWAFGIFEFQLNRLDREFAELNEEFYPAFGRQFFEHRPQLMQTLPIEEEIPLEQEALPYERVTTIVEAAQSFMVQDCICKKEKELLDQRCDKPMEVCLAIAPLPGLFDDHPTGKVISKEEAISLLRKCEEEGLVHLTANVQSGHIFICNCCGCCCGVLRSITELGATAASAINSRYYAQIDADECIDCGLCLEERCQVKAIEEGDDCSRVIRERCIGCGLCITTCPVEAISLIRKEGKEAVPSPRDEAEWFRERGRLRGVDFSDYE
jgi:NAD-dependent dihydropyrimidine dehydrogenase PreA subunit